MADISQVTLPDNNTYDIKAKELASQSKTISNVAIASFSDGADNVPVSELIVDIEAEQDLHGYDKPWIGGAGKNKLPNTASTSTIDGVTYTVNDDGSITASGTSTGWTGLTVGTCTLPAGTYKVSSGILNYDGYYFETQINGVNYNTAHQPVSIPFRLEGPTEVTVKAYVIPSYLINNVTGYPMIIIDSESDLTYEPYSNICPISGWNGSVITRCGTNIWDEEWELGTITNGINTPNNNRIRTKNYIPVLPTQYYINTAKWNTVFGYDKNKTYIGNVSYTASGSGYILNITNNIKYIRVAFSDAYGTTYNNDISINYPSTDHDYHAFNGGTDTIDFGQTVYGGTLNVTTGLLTITHGKCLLDGNTPDTDIGVTLLSGYTQVSYTPFINEGKADSIFLSNIFETATSSGLYKIWNNASVPRMFLGLPDTVTTRSEAIAWFASNPTEVICELENPTTVQLTPTEVRTLLADNNIFADTGDINELVYFKTGCESITDIINVMHDDSKMSYSNVYGKKTCNQLTDPGIYYNIDPTGSPAEGYYMTTLITTYNCQILVYLGLVVNTRRVAHIPGRDISFGPWKRLANEDDLDGAVIPYNAEYSTTNTIYDEIEALKSPSVQTVTLSSSAWNSSTHLITVNVTGVTSTSVQDVIGLPATSSANISNNEALQDANIMDAGQASGTLTFYAENVPTTDLQIRVIVRG